MLVGKELISLFICIVVVVSLMLLYLFFYVQYIFFILFTGSLMGLLICLFIYLLLNIISDIFMCI